MMEIDKHGDLLEQKYADFIKSYLSGYDKIWSNYIGNDGTSHMPEIDGLEHKDHKDRQLFSQYIYTCLESLICLYGIVKNTDNICQVDFQEPGGLEKYVHLINTFIAYHAHAGRIRDLLGEMGNLFSLEDLNIKLNEYYQRRNNVLHESKVPFGFIEGVVSMLIPGGESSDPTKWHNGKLWSDESNTAIEFIDVYLKETFQEIVTLTNNSLESLYSSRIAPMIKEHGIELIPTAETYELPPPSASGISDSSQK